MGKTISNKELARMKKGGFTVVSTEKPKPDPVEKFGTITGDAIKSLTNQVNQSLLSLNKKSRENTEDIINAIRDGHVPVIIKKREWEMTPERDDQGLIKTIIIKEI
jgi:hypothetical protein